MTVVAFTKPSSRQNGIRVENHAVLAALSRASEAIRQVSDLVGDSALSPVVKLQIMGELNAAAFHSFGATVRFVELGMQIGVKATPPDKALAGEQDKARPD